jgi:VWFA-related protein
MNRHRSHPLSRAVLAACAASLAASGPAAEPQADQAKPGSQAAQEQHQPPPAVPVFGSEVQLITVDAVVLDKKHHPVAGLTKDDFVVTEDGKPVEIVSFEAFAQPESEPEAPETVAFSPVATNVKRASASGRAFAVLVDDVNTAPQRSEDAKRAVRSFLETGVRAGDEVVVGTTSGDVWWTGRIPESREDLVSALDRLRGKYEESFTFNDMTEYEAFRIANYEDTPSMTESTAPPPQILSGRAPSATNEPLPQGMGGVRERVRKRFENQMLCQGSACEPQVHARAMQIDAARRGRVNATLTGVARGLEALRGIHGRKSLLLFSDGFITDAADRRTREVVALSREANTAVYFLDIRGLTAMPGSGTGTAADPGPGINVPMETVLSDRGAANFEENVLAATGSEGLASDTGGFTVRNTNDFGGGAGRIADESRVFYLLGFNAPEGKPPTSWRKLKVTARRDGLEVRARKGYTLAVATPVPKKPKKRDEPREPDPVVMHAVDSPHDATALPLRARVYVLEPGKKETKVLVAAEFDTRGLPETRHRPRRLEMSAVVRMRDAPLEYRYDQLVELGSEDEKADTPWRSVVRDFGLPPGVGSARVVLRDPDTGAVGSVSTRFEVPAPDLLRLSTPILSSRVEPAGQKGARPQPAISVDREFPAGGGLYCQFEVVGARKGEDGKPKVTAGVSIWTNDGGRVRESPASPVAADANGRTVRLVGIDLTGLPEGAYDMVLEVQDEIAGTRVRQREPFSLAATNVASSRPGDR